MALIRNDHNGLRKPNKVKEKGICLRKLITTITALSCMLHAKEYSLNKNMISGHKGQCQSAIPKFWSCQTHFSMLFDRDLECRSREDMDQMQDQLNHQPWINVMKILFQKNGGHLCLSDTEEGCYAEWNVKGSKTILFYTKRW